MNMQIPVGSIALAMPFHDATMVYFCLAVKGSRGSGGAGGGGSPGPALVAPLPCLVLAANLPSSHPILLIEIENYRTIF
jgi:hypothetical protein